MFIFFSCIMLSLPSKCIISIINVLLSSLVVLTFLIQCADRKRISVKQTHGQTRADLNIDPFMCSLWRPLHGEAMAGTYLGSWLLLCVEPRGIAPAVHTVTAARCCSPPESRRNVLKPTQWLCFWSHIFFCPFSFPCVFGVVHMGI